MTTALEGGWGVSVTPRPHFTPRKDPVPIVKDAGRPPVPIWTGAENLDPTGLRSPHRPPHSQSLYHLSYSAHSNTASSQFFQTLSQPVIDLFVIVILSYSMSMNFWNSVCLSTYGQKVINGFAHNLWLSTVYMLYLLSNEVSAPVICPWLLLRFYYCHSVKNANLGV